MAGPTLEKGILVLSRVEYFYSSQDKIRVQRRHQNTWGDKGGGVETQTRGKTDLSELRKPSRLNQHPEVTHTEMTSASPSYKAKPQWPKRQQECS